MRNTLVLGVMALLVASCGGGSSGPSTPVSRIDGTAATGAPLRNAAVEVKCAAGSGRTSTDLDGRFSVEIPGAQAPCLLKAEGGGSTLVSATPASSGTANVTSLTHLMSARMLGVSPAAAYAGADAAAFARITAQGASAAQGGVGAELLRIGAQMPSVDWVSSPFTAAPGDAMDGALELLKTSLAAQNKTLDQAADELAGGPLLDIVPPDQITCIPGMIAGFDGPLQDQLSRVVSQPDIGGGGDGPGGIGAGDGGGDGAAGGVGVGGSLGQFVNVDVTAEFAGGVTFGPTRVDAATGMVTLVPCNLQAPVLVTFTGAPGSGATYFDEQLGSPASFEGATIRGILTRLDRNGGVTPFTEAMVRRTIALGAQVATDGGVRLKAIEKDVDAWRDPARVQIAHDEVLRAVNDLLPGIYRLEDLRRLPVVVGPGNAQPDSGALTDNQNGVYGAVLGGLAKAAARSQPTSTAPALAIQQQIADDLEDGVLNLRKDAATPVPQLGDGTYQYDTFAARLTSETGAIAKALGSGSLKTATVPVQRLKGKAGTSFEAGPSYIFTLLSDGSLSIVPTGGPPVQPPAVPAGQRFVRIDVFDRSTRTPPGNPDPWQNCFIATAIDGQRLFTWRVGLAEDFQVRDLSNPTDPVVSILPESLSADQLGGDNVFFARRSGNVATTLGCDEFDDHPQVAQGAAGHYVVQAFQDFGNRYLVYSDGNVQGWGINRGALGVGETGESTLPPGEKAFLRAEDGAAGELTGVAMLARGQDLQQSRALLRTSEAARDGKVVVWGRDVPVPRTIAGLDDICWIAGPYAVACNGQLLHATVTATGGGSISADVHPVAGVPPIWRVNADLPIARTVVEDPDEPGVDQVESLILGYSAIAADGRIFELDGTTAIEVAQ